MIKEIKGTFSSVYNHSNNLETEKYTTISINHNQLQEEALKLSHYLSQ
jgi:hypothetical protein